MGSSHTSGPGLTPAQSALLTSLAPGADGALPVSRDGAWSVGVDKDAQAKSLTAEDLTGTANVEGGVVTATEQPSGAQSKLYGDGTLLGNTYQIDPPMFEGLQVAGPSPTNPPALVNFTITAKSATGDISAAECDGRFITNTGQSADAVLTLPAAVAGLWFQFMVTATGHAVSFKPASGEVMSLDGTRQTADHKVSLVTPALDDYAQIFCVTAGVWFVNTGKGVYSDGGT